ncbi:nonribosomal peptide synthase side [Tricladium varicosporioides]|nr:nonribosomal peptide synthase side [Hymenoscyphus varicosporioides]
MAVQVLQKSPVPFLQRGRKLVAEFDEILTINKIRDVTSLLSNSKQAFESISLVHSLIERQVEKTPNSTAVQFEAQHELTYQQLNSTTNAVARQLEWARGTIVPIAVSRSTNLIIALLAVLKAGAAYVLLSTESPLERNRFIIKDTKALFIIVDKNTPRFFEGAHVISIEDLVAQSRIMDQKYCTNLNIYQASSEIAYVIYTSGTTGNPKGVLLSHAAAYNGISAMPSFDESQPFRQLLCHSPNFSAAQRTILGTLCRGGTLCLASKDNITLHLNDSIEKMKISSIEITPSMLKLVDPSTLPVAVKRITLGGEAIGPALVDTWAGRVELVSAYGLSECTQLNMRHQLKPGHSSRTIGRPSDSTTYHVLAPGSLDHAPLTVPGELCLGGDQLAEGYLNLFEKTQEVFIDNPFGVGRLYRTGDMVVVNKDGTIELIGRIDQQIKIDGQRVEPNESNSIIQVQPGVVQSCVISALVLNRRSLVALLVPKEKEEWTNIVREIRSILHSQLPPYAIPRYWVQQKEIPLNSSGKVDISGLVKTVESMDASKLVMPSYTSSILSPQSLLSSSTSSANKNDFESRIFAIVASVLSISLATSGIEASFQELGGSSLDAIIVSSKLRKVNIHVSVSDILQSSSIRDISACHTESNLGGVAPPLPFSLLPERVMLDLTGLEDAYPVTPLQEGILADSISGNLNYIYQRIYKLQGVSPSLLRSAMETVLASSSILRTAFFPWKRTFMQVVKPKTTLPWKIVRGKSLESFLHDTLKNKMSLEEPLVRGAVINDEFLVLEMHHALFDFWSSQFIIEDTIAILQGNYKIPRMPFSSYIAYQQHVHDDNARDFWKGYLQSAAPTILDLTIYTESKQKNEPLVLSYDLGSGLADFSHHHSVTIGTVLHAAWALTLASTIGSKDVTFATAFSGRDADIDGILSLDGPTLCAVPMRVRVDDTTSAVDFTKSMQGNLWNLSKFAHSGMRNALAAGSLKPSCFNTMVNLLVKLQGVPEDSPLVPILVHGDNFTQYITIEVSEIDPTSVKMLVPYSADQASAQSLLESFANIVRSMAENPDRIISPVHWVDSLIQEATLEDFPISSNSMPHFGLAHSAFESFAASTPTKIALRTSTGLTLSYGELNAKANSFASWLISQGVQLGEIIPLYMEKSVETLISILGILKSGASFTPLDPLNPHDRNAFIIKDVGALRIVSDRKNREACTLFGIELIITADIDLSSHSGRNPEIPNLTPNSVIYAIYTSGSTGLPKGVLVQHSAVAASTEGMIEATTVTSDWNALWVLNYVFDASYYDIFTIFSAGATLCIAPQDELLSNLAKYINELEIEQVMLTPTITRLISGGPAQVPRLKVLNVCGEKIDVNILKWAQSVDVYNGYGPTEATILMTVSHVKPGSDLNSIGFPLKHATAVILPPEGGSLERVPHGTVGELCVRGPHLAKGYLNQPEQTNAAFVRDTDRGLLYRTGDLARWAEDGSLECLGRKDYQIKLNGFRIELGEIENAILHTGQVDAAIVSVAEVHGKRQLVSFCIFKGDHQPGSATPLPPAERLERVSNLLPQLTTISSYMIPALFLPFRYLPTLPSGKTNRKALVALVESMQKADIAQYIPNDRNSDEFQAASTEQEHVMRQAWASVLDEPEELIGANSVFLSLGGDSISAINIVAACRQLSYNISVSHIMSNSTLAEQAKYLKQTDKKKAAMKVTYVVPQSVLSAIGNAGINYAQSIEDIYPCGPGQNEFLIQGHKKQQFWNLTACRKLPLEFDLELWKQVTTQLTAKNQILRTMYYQANRNDDSSWHQVILREPVLDYEYIFYITEAEKAQYIDDLRDSLFAFGKPNIKYRVLHSLEDGSRTLCIKVDHGSYDGTLLRIFDDQFKAIAHGGTEIPLINPFKQFIDWACSGDRSKALQYWKNSLGTYKPNQNLPLQPIADQLRFIPVSADVDSIALNFGVTPSTVFQAAYSLVAGRLSGATDVLVDNLVTGRNADVESPQLLNGTCANFLPFRSQLSETDTIKQFLKYTQAQFWDTTEHGTVGLHDIYATLNKDRQVHCAKMLYCFQPFEPAPTTTKADHMSWIVMAQSQVFMSINYALMVEVQKTLQGHRFKLQWDNRALNNEEIGKFVVLFEEILGEMGRGKDGRLADLMSVETDLEGLWKG